ncbi:MAG: pectin esterase, partial [Clostridia bacterium]|nr:pectin esterase [Clostridia bacterium]
MTALRLTPEDDLQKIINGLSEPAEIILAEGIYRQKIEIRADGVKIRGENRDKTVIAFDDYAKKIHADGKEYNTFRTYTVCVTGENVTLENLTIENTNTDPREAGQCVALSVNAKRFFAENVTLKSMQDTLFLYPFPDDLVVRYDGFIPQKQLYCEGESLHFFNCCEIYGTVDFIFGCAEAYFLNCKIYSVADQRNIGFIAAPAHSLKQEHGFTFLNCEMISDGAEDNTCYLARPWRDFGKCQFLNCRLGKHVKPELFDKWNDTCRDKTARFLHFGLEPILY